MDVTPTDVLLVDVDLGYEGFVKYLKAFYEEHVELILSKFGLTAVAVEYKKSTNGNTHIKIKLDKPVDYRTYLHLMLALGCDPGLVSISLRRLEAFGDPLVKQFYRKVRVSLRERRKRV